MTSRPRPSVSRLAIVLPAVVLGCVFNPGPAQGPGGSGNNNGNDGGAGISGSAGAGGSVAGTAGSGGSTGGAGTTGSAGSSGNAGSTGAGGSIAGTGNGGASGTTCDPTGPKCNNCMDDDHDGLTDAADPECIGPYDNDEDTFATGIPGDNMDACKQDCFFDGDSGAGNDGCDWNLKCDPLDPGSHLPKTCPYNPGTNNCPGPQSAQCQTFCQARTPNGCDCFGCCLVPGAPHAIYLAPTCTAALFNDPTKCPACTQVTSCMNTCGHCEICVGKPTLPADCSVSTTGAGGASGGSSGSDGGASGGAGGGAGSGGSPCDPGQTYCGPGGGVDPLSCPPGSYCITGCCRSVG